MNNHHTKRILDLDTDVSIVVSTRRGLTFELPSNQIHSRFHSDALEWIGCQSKPFSTTADDPDPNNVDRDQDPASADHRHCSTCTAKGPREQRHPTAALLPLQYYISSTFDHIDQHHDHSDNRLQASRSFQLCYRCSPTIIAVSQYYNHHCRQAATLQYLQHRCTQASNSSGNQTGLPRQWCHLLQRSCEGHIH